MASWHSLLQVIWEEERAFPAHQEIFPAVGSLQLRMFIYSCQSMGQNKLVWRKGSQVQRQVKSWGIKHSHIQAGQPAQVSGAARIYWPTNALCSSGKPSWIGKKDTADPLCGSSSFFGDGNGYANTKTLETLLASLGCNNQYGRKLGRLWRGIWIFQLLFGRLPEE